MENQTIFDGAKLRVQVKQSREGAGPVVAERDFPGLEARLEGSSTNGARTGAPTGPRRSAPRGRRGRARRFGAVPGLARRRTRLPTLRLHQLTNRLTRTGSGPGRCAQAGGRGGGRGA
ncbi:hypothetical protein GCM10010343_11750 [Streptomyces avidinii]|nr:hypothetical protein GCM10010343_11750 [Streptomyces avidinii]